MGWRSEKDSWESSPEECASLVDDKFSASFITRPLTSTDLTHDCLAEPLSHPEPGKKSDPRSLSYQDSDCPPRCRGFVPISRGCLGLSRLGRSSLAHDDLLGDVVSLNALDAQAKIRGMVFLARLCTNALVWKCKAHKRKTPEDDLGGKRKGRFLKVCRVKTVGLIAQGTPTGKVWSCGLRRRIDPLPADRGLEKTGTPVISEPRLPSFGVWEIGPGA